MQGERRIAFAIEQEFSRGTLFVAPLDNAQQGHIAESEQWMLGAGDKHAALRPGYIGAWRPQFTFSCSLAA